MLALLSGLGACATITRGTSEQFTINSNPSGAEAHTTSGFSCASTPCSIRMPRKDGFTIMVSKAGYQTVSTEVRPKLAGNGAAGFVGNALIGGVIGAAVDVGSGATMDLTPNPLNVTLEPVAVATASPSAASPMSAPVPVPASAPAATTTPAAPLAAPSASPAAPVASTATPAPVAVAANAPAAPTPAIKP